ncbi:unnamed protein product [Lathyrus oleraceus]
MLTGLALSNQVVYVRGIGAPVLCFLANNRLLCWCKVVTHVCFVKLCKITYHVPCAMNISTCRRDHVYYLLLCPSHSNVTFPIENSSHKKKSIQEHIISSQLPFQQPNNLLGRFKE